MNKPRVAVLGAGPMGLAVAYQLVRDGYAPVLFEADDRLGGMTASFDFGGLPIERFYHFHCLSDAAFLEALGELGLSDRMRWIQTKMGYFFEGRVHPWGTALALLKFPGIGLVGKIRYGLHALASTRRDDWSDLDGKDAKTWIRDWLGQEAFDVMWKQLFALKFYHYAENLSAAWIWSRIRRIGRSRDKLMRERLGYLEGGSQTFLDAMGAAITRGGGTIRLSTPVSKVVIEDAVVKGVEAAGAFEPFDAVVSTVPLPYVSRMIPDLPADVHAKLASLSYMAVVCVIVKLKKAVNPNFWLNIIDPSMDIPGLVEYTNLRPLSEHIVYVPYYLPGDHPKFQEPNEVFVERVKGYLKRINPELRDEDFLDVRASRYRYAQPICEPKFLERLPPIDLPIRGLYAADTSYYYPEDRGISESVGLGRQIARMVRACFQAS